MKIAVICKASTEIGFGHLIRSKTFVAKLLKIEPQFDVQLVIIGRNKLKKLVEGEIPHYAIISKEQELTLPTLYDICFIDMTEMSTSIMQCIKQQVRLTVSLSPIFNQMQAVDLFFNRTQYYSLEKDKAPAHIYAGFKYAFVQKNCTKINAGIYEENLESVNFPIAISMGGGDAANKTLRFLQSLKKCKVPATFWVMLGEGYQHSYDALINEIRKDSNHEIILAKTNRSMWQILKNCILAILPGGITTYEATYAGLPTISLFQSEKQQFLVKELVEKNACINLGLINDENLEKLNRLIEELYYHRQQLLQMHVHSKNLIDDHGVNRILNTCLEHLKRITSQIT